ncbi:class I alpha-mannosidase-like protein [Bimuria novae-zelandiae CBS 107.79]|uniref:alpha-1,2-Mannosidase n=1 Tax=Bimuria novae-zelandiae CBS 107.79 TaxID=1447943 RepID=A0A6A5V007_9PLEO|nr:class I alpha-mannosidase-like protein [Bimuria novae-zelandiae CBS 107.79]
MGFFLRRLAVASTITLLLFLAYRQFALRNELLPTNGTSSSLITSPVVWKDIPQRYPVSSTIALPTGTPLPIPCIQHHFGVETENNKAERLQRQAAVKQAFVHSWEGYKKHAWLQDEVAPLSASYRNNFGNRGATLVDSLDTLLIMGLDEDFDAALRAVAQTDFSTTAEPVLNVFETNIRYLGGLLSAYDLGHGRHPVLLEKAAQLGDMLYGAFDTPNRLPITRWDWVNGALREEQEAPMSALSAELGSLSLEFTRLSQLTGDAKYYDAIQRISNLIEEQQNATAIPGLIPITVSPIDNDLTAYKTFTFGAMSDSLYEYLPKEYMLLGGRQEQYRTLYERAIEAAKQHLFFRPLNIQNQDILISGNVRMSSLGMVKLDPEAQHLACFAGGMVAIAAKIFNRTDELNIARKLIDGCIWAYDSTPTNIMPETFHVVPCKDPNDCEWNTERWHRGVLDRHVVHSDRDPARIIDEDGLQPGMTKIGDKRFLLRPEAIESIFILYRITGDSALQDAAWRMFTAITKATETLVAHSAIEDVTVQNATWTKKLDECESFWMAETLKYFYLIFSATNLVSLDEYVFNTEAHPLRRPQAA